MTTHTITAPPTTAYELCGWDLSELLPAPSEEVIARRFAELEAALLVFEASRPSLSPAMEPPQLLAVLRRFEGLDELTSLLSGYASLWFYSDTGNQEAITFRNRVRQAVTAATNRMLFFTLWWKGLSDAEAEALLPAGTSTRLADYRHFLLGLRRFSPYTLDETSEQIINVKDDNGIAAVLMLYSMLTNRLEFTLEVDGESKRLTRDGLTAYAFSSRPELRAAAYRQLYRVYAGEATILGQIYGSVVRDWNQEAVGLRGYASAIPVRNTDHDVPDP